MSSKHSENKEETLEEGVKGEKTNQESSATLSPYELLLKQSELAKGKPVSDAPSPAVSQVGNVNAILSSRSLLSLFFLLLPMLTSAVFSLGLCLSPSRHRQSESESS